MVFSSLSSYLDPPSTWLQKSAGGGILVVGSDATPSGSTGGGGNEICQFPPPPVLSPPPLLGSGGGSGTRSRSLHILDPGMMTKLPQPDHTAMKCPRCESTNTKFCYFNNYSLSQPRHFCKTCRRYWTRGGALRNVPVGGSCRRNKKTNKGSSSRGSRSKSPSAPTPISSTTNTTHISISPNFPILPPFHHLGGGDLGNLTDMINLGHDSNYPRTKFAHFGSVMEASDSGMYGEGSSSYVGQVSGMKMEETHHHHHQQQQQGMMNMSRNFLGISGNDQILGTSNIYGMEYK